MTSPLVDHGQWLDILFNQDGDKVAVGAILADGDRAGVDLFGQTSVPLDIQSGIHLGKGERVSLQGESIRGIGGRLAVLFALETGILRVSSKEVLEGLVQMAKCLLNGHAGDLCQPGTCFLEIGQHGREVIIGKLLATFLVGSSSGSQDPNCTQSGNIRTFAQEDASARSLERTCTCRPASSSLLLCVFLDRKNVLQNGRKVKREAGLHHLKR